mgnify:CR=1 FL=1
MTVFFWIIELSQVLLKFSCVVFFVEFLTKEKFGDRKLFGIVGSAGSALLITELNKIELFSFFNSMVVLVGNLFISGIFI